MAKSVEQRKPIDNREEWRIGLLEKEIESETNSNHQNNVRHPLQQDIRKSNNRKTMTVSELEDKIRKYQMRKTDSQYTAKALEPFLNSMNMAGILFNNDQEEGGEENQWRHLIEGISLDEDIQLNNFGENDQGGGWESEGVRVALFFGLVSSYIIVVERI